MRSILSNLPTEVVRLFKPSGEEIDDIRANVQPGRIFVDDPNVIIEENDVFVRSLPNGAMEYHLVVDRGFYKGTHGISDHYQTKTKKISKPEMDTVFRNREPNEKAHKIFVSHSSKDKRYVEPLVELLEEIGLPDDSIVCTSVPGHGIPGNARIYEWLREQFIFCDLRVVFILSKNYYDSPASLNEMGASWVTKTTETIILLPQFDFSDIKGCIDSTKIGIKLDGDEEELKHRLNELKDTLITEYKLPMISQIRWERHRDAFIKKINIILNDDITNEEQLVIQDSFRTNELLGVMNAETCVMLLYAAEGDGQILISRTMSTSIFCVGGRYNMNGSQAPREIAKWDAAVETLISHGYVKKMKQTKSDLILKVTQSGYEIADSFKDINKIDTQKTPAEIIAWLNKDN